MVLTISGPSIEERAFGPLVPGRACGDCTACCSEIEIRSPDLQKPARELCVHCVGQGCSIYETRPEDCRSWYCAWRRIAPLDEEIRPDRSGFMACLSERPDAENPLERLYIIVNWLDNAPIARSREADEMLAALRRCRLPVWVGTGDRMSLHHPRAEIALHLINGTVAAGEAGREVEAWRRLLPPRQGTSPA